MKVILFFDVTIFPFSQLEWLVYMCIVLVSTNNYLLNKTKSAR